MTNLVVVVVESVTLFDKHLFHVLFVSVGLGSLYTRTQHNQNRYEHAVQKDLKEIINICVTYLKPLSAVHTYSGFYTDFTGF